MTLTPGRVAGDTTPAGRIGVVAFGARRHASFVGGKDKVQRARFAGDAVLIADVTVRRAFDASRRVLSEVSRRTFSDARSAFSDVDEHFGVALLAAGKTVTFAGTVARDAVLVASQTHLFERRVRPGRASRDATGFVDEVSTSVALLRLNICYHRRSYNILS